MSIFSKIKAKKVIEKIDKKSMIKRYFNMFLGLLLVAISYNLFIAPNNIVPGGVGGLAIIFNRIFNINNSITMLVANALLLILSYYLLGKEQTKSTILGSILFPVLVEITKYIGLWIQYDNTNLLLSVVFGGVMYGFGMGLILKAGFTTGGTDILNQISSKYLKMSMGNSMLLCDGLIVIASGFIFGATKLMYSIIVLYIISLMSDRVILGISDSKAFYIITSKEDEIQAYILQALNHGVTIFNARGGYANSKQKVLMCVLPTKDYYRLKTGIMEIDDKAFVVVTDAYEVFGGE